MKIYPVILGLLVILLPGCEEPYEPKIDAESQNILVVEGHLSSGVSSIFLSRSSPLQSRELLPENGAVVRLYNSGGDEIEEFTSAAPGRYEASLSLQENLQYRVEIITANNVVYTSEWLQINQAPAIEKLDWEVADARLKIKLSSRGTAQSTAYYRYEFTETWQYQSAFEAKIIYRDGAVHPLPLQDRFYNCYYTEPSRQIVLASTAGLSENYVSEKIITEINPLNSYRLNMRYSIAVKQYNISREAFEFYERLKNNTEELGGLFDPQPSQLISNIQAEDSDIPVIGYISAGAVAEKRIYIQRDELPFTRYYNDLKDNCKLDTVPPPMSPIPALEYFEAEIYMPVTIIGNGLYTGASKQCVDCRELGGTTEIPAFW